MTKEKFAKSFEKKSRTKMEKTLEKLLDPLSEFPRRKNSWDRKPHKTAPVAVEGDFLDAFGINLHLGHDRRTRNPFMTGYLFGQRKGVGDFFDLREFSRHLKKAYYFVEEVKNLGGQVIFVAKDKTHYKLLLTCCATHLGSSRDAHTPLLLEKWTPGLLTQGRLLSSPATSQFSHSFKEKANLPLEEGKAPALIISFGNKLLPQIKREAILTRTPLVAVVDSDQDPRGITYVIPCNDDSYKVQYFLGRVLLDPFFH